MTFEEFNRAMEFIVQQEAAFSVKLDRDHEWAKGLIQQLAVGNKRALEMIDSNMRRLDENDKEHRKFVEFQQEAQRRHVEFQQEAQRAQRRHEETVMRLDSILSRLTENGQKPN